MTPQDRQRLAEGLAALQAAANGTPMYDRLLRWLLEGGPGDPAELLAYATFEAPCPQCGYQGRRHDLVKEVQDLVLDRLLDEQHPQTVKPAPQKEPLHDQP